MQVMRLNILLLKLAGIRHLYSASALGIDGFLNTKKTLESQLGGIANNFKQKMKECSEEDCNKLIFTEDLKQMLHIAEGNQQDLQLVKQMIVKFSKQNKTLRFGSFIFGPVVMRMYYCLDKPKEALDIYKMFHNGGLFDQLITHQILMDLLLINHMYDDVIEVFEIVKKRQLKGLKYPKNAVVLVVAACYKLNTPSSYSYAKELWADLMGTGHVPMRRAVTFTAALAIQQNEPFIAIEILTSLKNQSYITVRNLKVLALAEFGRPDDALPLLRNALLRNTMNENKSTLCEEVMSKLCDSVFKFGRTEVIKEYERIEKELKDGSHIVKQPLSDFLCSEINITHMNSPSNKSTRRSPQHPSLQDML